MSRSFTVDTVAPPAPTITDTDPNSPANDNNPEVKGTAAAGTTVRLYKTAGCTGTPVGVRSAANFASPGITASVPDNTTTAFRARAADAAGNLSACSGASHLRRGLDAVASADLVGLGGPSAQRARRRARPSTAIGLGFVPWMCRVPKHWGPQ